MKDPDFLKIFSLLQKVIVSALVVLFLALGVFWLVSARPDLFEPAPDQEALTEPALIQASTETDTELFKEGEHRLLVIANCTGCHSAKLVTQNRATREGWRNMIRWMQETQNLKDLGADEEKILDYLSANYAPTEQGRRQNLTVEEWYRLE